jgi:hypothetical protein
MLESGYSLKAARTMSIEWRKLRVRMDGTEMKRALLLCLFFFLFFFLA